jgi:hypothetical protein
VATKASSNSFPEVVENVEVVTVELAVVPSPHAFASKKTGGLGTVIVTPEEGLSRLPLSSTARLMIFTEPVTNSVVV